MTDLLILLVGLCAGSCISVMTMCLLTINKQHENQSSGKLNRMLDEPIGGRIDKRV